MQWNAKGQHHCQHILPQCSIADGLPIRSIFGGLPDPRNHTHEAFFSIALHFDRVDEPSLAHHVHALVHLHPTQAPAGSASLGGQIQTQLPMPPKPWQGRCIEPSYQHSWYIYIYIYICRLERGELQAQLTVIYTCRFARVELQAHADMYIYIYKCVGSWR